MINNTCCDGCEYQQDKTDIDACFDCKYFDNYTPTQETQKEDKKR